MKIFQEPNKYCQIGSMKIDNNTIEVKGYNCYTVTKDTIKPENYAYLTTKYSLLKNISPRFQDKTVLDLGASTGFYSLWASQEGAVKVTAVDMDINQIGILKQIIQYLGFDNIEVVVDNIENCIGKYNIVFALALVHWIYSCTAVMGLDEAIGFISGLTKEMAIIEWVDPNDPVFDYLRQKEGSSHIEFNSGAVSEPYNYANFTEALKKHFHHIKYIGDVCKTRSIYMGYK